MSRPKLNKRSIGSIIQCSEMIPSRIVPRSRYLTRLAKANFCSSVLTVKHDPVRSEFTVSLHDSKAFVSYTYDQKNRKISIDHTEVPQIFQGKGVGKKLVEVSFIYFSVHLRF